MSHLSGRQGCRQVSRCRDYLALEFAYLTDVITVGFVPEKTRPIYQNYLNIRGIHPFTHSNCENNAKPQWFSVVA